MKSKVRRILGIAGTLGMVGLIVYSVKKYYDAKKENEQAIDAEEAKRIVAEARDRKESSMDNIEGIMDMENIKFGARDKAHYDPTPIVTTRAQSNSENIEDESPIAIKTSEAAAARQFPPPEEEEEETAWYEGPDPQEVQDSIGYYEEDKDVIDDLRYEPNTIEAREQFINMELANLGRDNDTRDMVAMLYDFPFLPVCDEDENLRTRLMDHRAKFFGPTSQWTTEIAFGDVIMYYGKSAEYNCGNDMFYWVSYFLSCADLENITLTSDEINNRIVALNHHNSFNSETQSYGLFGLSEEQMTEAFAIANKRIDEKVTYDIEFNVFANGVV